MKTITVIIGPTGIGKSAYALSLAQENGAEIISADAFQVYKGMDIGTAKISKEEQALVPHHLIDILEPNQPYDVTQFVNQTNAIISSLQKNSRPSIICGGTGLYIQAFLYNYTFPSTGENLEIRETLEAELKEHSAEWLWKKLETIDPISASKIPVQNSRRVIRALEIYLATQKKPSEAQSKTNTIRDDVHIIGLKSTRENIIHRINARVDTMIKNGLIEEVKTLLNHYPPTCKAFEALGYKETIQYLNNEISKMELIERIKIHTRQFAKRQMTWFNKLPNVEWLEIAQ